MQRQYTSVSITVAELQTDEKVNAFELALFLQYFRAAYVSCLQIPRGKYIIDGRLKNITLEELIDINPLLNQPVSRLWATPLQEGFDLEFTQISKQSPMEFLVEPVGHCFYALTIAVILSGGRVNLLKGEFELPPFSQTIRQLMSVFKEEQPSDLPSELRMEDKESSPPTPKG